MNVCGNVHGILSWNIGARMRTRLGTYEDMRVLGSERGNVKGELLWEQEHWLGTMHCLVYTTYRQ
jgi:hypothetical protein